jgi:hypothetical protein
MGGVFKPIFIIKAFPTSSLPFIRIVIKGENYIVDEIEPIPLSRVLSDLEPL